MNLNAVDANTEYTTVDLNATGTTSIYAPSSDATVYGVYLENGGSTAELQLEATDGSDTVILSNPGAGEGLSFSDMHALGGDQTLQVNVTVAEGAAQTNTAAVFRTA